MKEKGKKNHNAIIVAQGIGGNTSDHVYPCMYLFIWHQDYEKMQITCLNCSTVMVISNINPSLRDL